MSPCNVPAVRETAKMKECRASISRRLPLFISRSRLEPRGDGCTDHPIFIHATPLFSQSILFWFWLFGSCAKIVTTMLGGAVQRVETPFDGHAATDDRTEANEPPIHCSCSSHKPVSRCSCQSPSRTARAHLRLALKGCCV